MSRSPRGANAGLLVWILACALFFSGSSGCSAAQWAKTKAHGVESGAAGLGGAAAISIGGPFGFLVFISLAAVGVIVNEQLQPPDKVLVITVDAAGHVLKTERFQPTETTGAPKAGERGLFGFLADFSWGVARLVFYVLLGIFALKWVFGPRYRELVAGTLGHALEGVRSLVTANFRGALEGAKGAVRTARQASGMAHSEPKPLHPRAPRA